MKNPKHWNDTEVFLFTSTGLEGSRFPKSNADVWVVNRQNPLDMTVEVTDTDTESTEYPIPATTKIERVIMATGTAFN